MLSHPLHQSLLNDFQQDFPIVSRPYQAIAEQLNVTEEMVLKAFQILNDQRLISRIGAVIKPNCLGISSLVAMAIPEAQLAEIAELVNQYPEVNHNYERENTFNLWFVIIANDEVHLKTLLTDIEKITGFKTMSLPLLTEYFINLGFDLNWHD